MSRAFACLPVGLGALFLAGCIGVSQPRREATGAGAVATCPRGARPAADGELDDFEDGDTQLSKLGGRDGHWFAMKDAFGSTVSILADDGGADGSELAMHVKGTTTAGQGGDNWGAGVGVNLVSQGLFFDASKYAGIAFKAKAGPRSSRRIRFKLGDVNTHPDAGVCTQCWNHFGADLTLTGHFRTYELLFADAQQEPGWGAPRPSTLTPGKLVSLDWAVGPGQTFDLWLDDLVFLECR